MRYAVILLPATTTTAAPVAIAVYCAEWSYALAELQASNGRPVWHLMHLLTVDAAVTLHHIPSC
jgi:hypothetical protein